MVYNPVNVDALKKHVTKMSKASKSYADRVTELKRKKDFLSEPTQVKTQSISITKGVTLPSE